jgi:MFS family permease
MPLPILLTLLSPTMGRVAASFGPKLPLSVGSAVVAAGFVITALTAGVDGYWTSWFPSIVVMAVGMTIAVAPLTTSILGSVEEQHVAMASGFNSAVARTGGLIATALLGAVLSSSGAQLLARFHAAMLVSAVIAAAASVVGLLTLGAVQPSARRSA